MKAKNHTLQYNLMRSFSLLFLVVLLLTCIMIVWHSYTLQKTQYQRSTQNIANQKGLALDCYCTEIENLVISTATNTELLNQWRSSIGDDNYRALCIRQDIRDFFKTVMQSRTDIANISIFNEDRYVGASDFKELGLAEDYLEQVWADFKDDASYVVRYYSPHILDYQLRSSTDGLPMVISVACPIRDINRMSRKNEAIIIFDIYLSAIPKQISRIDTVDSMTLLLNGNNTVVYSSSSEYVVSEYVNIDTEPSTPWSSKAHCDLQSNDWSIVIVQPFSIFNTETIQILEIIITIFLIAFFVAAVFIRFFSGLFAKPIVKLSQYMETLDLTYHKPLPISSGKRSNSQEIENLYIKYNELIARILSLKVETYEAELKQKEANYAALQSQINPHFLNNVLQTIQSLAVLQRTEEIQYITSSMGDWMEYSLYAKTDFVSLSEEMEHIVKYLQLYKYRLGTEFSYTINMDDGCKSCIVPRFIIQPIVENSVLHGFNGAAEKKLQIDCQLLDDEILINIQDSGIGMDSDTLQKVVARLDRENGTTSSIGLSNVNQRIKSLYGSSYGIEIQSEMSFGTCVTIVMPNTQNTTGEQIKGE